ncbi:MAG: PBP1A family penicillin-binding protein [Alphaproteobacteria bacterium]|jgi:penicillin-binding protein 1A|nr:PBP1A family penicillin-binding protein [Alphaproteobacteria bacterium]MDP6816451.1 PBP1A family penicillin-binding protein [Alphaproteobacteria bacterium]
MAKSKGAPRGKKPPAKGAGAKPKPKAVAGAEKKPADRPRKSPWREIRVALIALIWLTLIAAGFIAYAAHDLPDSDSLTGPKSAPSVTILAADGAALARFGAHWGEFVSVAEMSPLLPQAVVAIEDRRFYEHGGMDVIGVLRAIWRNITAGRLREGGSTITQQLAKIAFLTPAKSLKRKVQELFLAFRLERQFSKDEILTLYLNRVYLGAGSYGVDAAAKRYFAKSARRVGLAEAALLAGLLKAPSRLSPARDLAAARRRAALVLDSMVAAGFLGAADAAAAKKAPARLVRQEKPSGAGRYFSDWIRGQLPAYAGRDAPALTVHTTLNPAMQRAAEAALARGLEGLSQRGVGQGALVALAPDGAVLAMVGGRDYAASQFNRASQARRQPGSAFKTIVYLAGLEAGLGPEDIFEDAPIEIAGWAPRNYSGDYRGPVSLRDAFAASINSVAVRVAQHAGINNVAELARRLGIHSDLPRDASLSLGSGDLTLIELTAAYAALAGDGALALPHGISEVRNRGGETVYARSGSGGGRVVSPEAAAAMRDLLAAVISDGTGKAAALPPALGPAYGKTGTSQKFRDAWFVGFAGDVVAGVWLGNDNGKPMQGVTGGGAPAAIWRDFMSQALR